MLHVITGVLTDEPGNVSPSSHCCLLLDSVIASQWITRFAQGSILQFFQGDLPPITVLWMVAIDAVQFQISGHCSELHIDPTMCVAFPKIITDRWLVDELEMVPLIMLPLVGMTIEISFGMLAFGEHFQ